jgi:hypothetical protein
MLQLLAIGRFFRASIDAGSTAFAAGWTVGAGAV